MLDKRKLMNKILLQAKFIIVAFLNFSKELLFYPLRNFYLLIFGITVPLSSSIHRGCKFFHLGKVKIGKHSVINSGCILDNRRGISIGDNTAIAHNTKIYTLGHNIDSPLFETKGAPVNIGNDCFIFSNVMIMPGVNIGNGAVVLPGSIVTKDVEPFTVVGGVPAKYIKDRVKEVNYTIDYNYWFAL